MSSEKGAGRVRMSNEKGSPRHTQPIMQGYHDIMMTSLYLPTHKRPVCYIS